MDLQQSSTINTSEVTDSEVIKLALSRVLSSDTFADTPRMQEFLRYIIEETLNGREKHIKGFSIAHDVFNRTDPEDAQVTSIVRVEAGRLRRLLETYYQHEAFDEPIRISIPKGAYIPKFKYVTDNSSRKTSNIKNNKAGNYARKLLTPPVVFIFSATILVTTLLIFQNNTITNRHSTNLQAKKLAIAVLPFEDATTDKSGKNIAEGLTENIITDLSSIASLDVIALSSVWTYQNRDISDKQIAEELNVTHILRGNIRGDKGHQRVTSHLIQTDTGRQIWAERFDRNSTDELFLQNSLAMTIVEGLSIQLGNKVNRPLLHGNIPNTEATSLYKQALNIANPPSNPQRLILASRIFYEVIDADNNFAGGYAGIGYTHAFMAWWGHSKSPEQDLKLAKSFAEQALAIDINFGLAHSALAFINLTQRNFDNALLHSAKAVNSQPNDPYVAAYHGFILSTHGDPKSGIPFAQHAIRLDPMNPRTPYRNILGVIYFYAGQYQNALNSFKRSRELGGPRNPAIAAYVVATYSMLGLNGEAKSEFDRLQHNEDKYDWRSWLTRALRKKDAKQVLNILQEVENS